MMGVNATLKKVSLNVARNAAKAAANRIVRERWGALVRGVGEV